MLDGLRLYLGSDSLQLFNAICYAILEYILIVVVLFCLYNGMNLFRVLSTLQPSGNSSVAQVSDDVINDFQSRSHCHGTVPVFSSTHPARNGV